MYKVVIIDDESWSREVVKQLGEWEDNEVEIVAEADEGQEGIKLIEETDADIVITDMRMPGLEGIELLQILNKQFPELKIIIMSGYDDFEYLREGIRSGAVEYLLKPIDKDDLNNSLGKCIRDIKKNRKDKTLNLAEFFSITELEKYSTYRQRIHEFLLKLNKSQVIITLNKLAEFLKNENEVSLPEKGYQIIFRDIILVLDEFCKDDFKEIYEKELNSQKKFIIKIQSEEELIKSLSTLYANTIDFIEESIKNKGQLNINSVKTYIDNHYQDQISLDTLSERFFVSKEHLSRTFKNQLDENISRYITRKRMKKAKDLICEQDLPIKNVAEVVGYHDLPYFYRVFKKYYRMTPGELRDINKVQ